MKAKAHVALCTWKDAKFSFHFISVHFIYVYLTTVASSICLDCFSGNRAKKYIIKNLKPTFNNLAEIKQFFSISW